MNNITSSEILLIDNVLSSSNTTDSLLQKNSEPKDFNTLKNETGSISKIINNKVYEYTIRGVLSHGLAQDE